MRAPAAEILAAAKGRPWPVPKRPWAMWQVWSDLLFAHWPIPAHVMAAALPPSLTLDTWEGEAWLGIVPFRMPTLHIHGLPDMPPFSRLNETNVRTYVRVGGLPGVYFFSLDADNPITIQIARLWFHLPYFNARFDCDFAGEGGSVRYAIRRADRRARPGVFEATYRPLGPARPAPIGSLEDWLTARYALYTADRQGRVYRGDITHAPWRLAPAEAEIRANTLADSHGFTLPDTPPLLHFSRRLDALAWTIRRVY
ncbi:MAG TPA: DUF2071 domain-containing protein [Ktedonobacterales bacterium]|nr:DUF2071 domain-containing protein [Ktedonobacterales bacterium]